MTTTRLFAVVAIVLATPCLAQPLTATIPAASVGAVSSTTAEPTPLPAGTIASAIPVVLEPVAAPSVFAKPAMVPAVLRAGTALSLRLVEAISTKNKVAHINDRVRFEVAEDLRINDVVIIPVGSPAVGELTDVRNKGMWGKSGRIVGRALTVNANGRTIRLSGVFDTKGGSGTVGAVAVSAIVFAPAGFFMTGKSAEFAAGSIIRAFIDEDVQLSIVSGSNAGNQPMVIKQP